MTLGQQQRRIVQLLEGAEPAHVARLAGLSTEQLAAFVAIPMRARDVELARADMAFRLLEDVA